MMCFRIWYILFFSNKSKMLFIYFTFKISKNQSILCNSSASRFFSCIFL